MASFQQQLQKAKKIQPKILENDLFKFIKSIEKVFLDKNREQIRNEGKDIFGNPIGFYSPMTEFINFKQRLAGKNVKPKMAGDPFTGEDSGDWLKGFYMQEVAGVLRFSSRDPKNSLILRSEDWLSHELFGLSDEDLKEVIQTRLLPFFIENSRNKLDI